MGGEESGGGRGEVGFDILGYCCQWRISRFWDWKGGVGFRGELRGWLEGLEVDLGCCLRHLIVGCWIFGFLDEIAS